VVAPARSIGVEGARGNGFGNQVFTGRIFSGNRPGGRDVIRGHGVTQNQQGLCPNDIRRNTRIPGKIFKVRRIFYIRGCFVPTIGSAFGHIEFLPELVAFENSAVFLPVKFLFDVGTDQPGDLSVVRPDLTHIHRLPVGIDSHRFCV